MKIAATLAATAAALALPAAGCGDDGKESAGAATTSQAPAATDATPGAARAPRRSGTRIVVKRSDYGRILFDGSDRAIYLFTRETGRRPRCYGDCAVAWPPVLTRGAPRAGRGVDSDLLGTTRRRDGKRQVTYKGHPLYYYVHDGRGQVLCQDVEEFGGRWYVVTPRGNADLSPR
jgi:predicted lipoprotein with Yx(FWY)xxD motif